MIQSGNWRGERPVAKSKPCDRGTTSQNEKLLAIKKAHAAVLEIKIYTLI